MTPERIEKLRAVLDRRQPDLTVITDYVHKGRNLSAIVRNADAVGIMAVHCAIGDKDYKAFRGTAKGSHHWVKVHRYESVNEPVALLKEQGHQVIAAHFSEQAVDYREIDYTRPTALLMGSELEGVSGTAEQLADSHVTIPMVGMTASFNVSVAAGIILMEAHNQRQQAGLYDQCRIDQETYNELFFEWGYRKLKHFCLSNDLQYPPLTEDGALDNPSQWYAQVRELLEQRDKD